MADDAPAVPACPITGLPARRRIQWVATPLLIALWRISCGVPTARQLRSVLRFGLWESPCGLAFFDPMIAGDAQFYRDFYRRLGEGGPWTGAPVKRSDYPRAAALVNPGEQILDVGCGPAGFARLVPHARYVGLERSAEARKIVADVRDETIAEHAAAHPGEYDVVCSFHVVEHIAEPAPFVTDMIRCLRPGGRLVVAVPSWPSALTEIPNFAPNGPPHHLTWWTEGALRALAATSGLIVESVEILPPSPGSSIVYWMGRAAPKLTGTRFFRHAWGWHLGLLWSWLAGRVCNALRRLPAQAYSFELLLVARKPG
jgi:SAM-dependent methyltransferase